MSTKQDNDLVPRITGLLILEVRKSNPNGDPERESSPRQRPDGKGEISPVSVKRKLRDLVLEKEGVVWSEIKASLGLSDDNFQILESRGRNRDEIKKKMEPKDGKIGQGFIDAYWDGRLFGNTFLEEGERTRFAQVLPISASVFPSLRLTSNSRLGPASPALRPEKIGAWLRWHSAS